MILPCLYRLYSDTGEAERDREMETETEIQRQQTDRQTDRRNTYDGLRWAF